MLFFVFAANFNIIKLLLDYGANINRMDAEGKTPLFYAIEKNDVKLVKFLLENGADFNIKDKYVEYSLTNFIEKNNIELLKLLIEYGVDINFKSTSGKASLFTALKNNDIEIVKLLIDNGVDVNVKNNEGKTPLMYALINNVDIDTIKLLIDCKSDLNTKDKFFKNALDYAIENSSAKVVKYLIYKMYGDEFICTCIDGDYNELKMKIEDLEIEGKENDINNIKNTKNMKRDIKSNIKNNIKNNIKRNIKNNITNINYFINDYYTPLMLAAKYNNDEEAVKLMIEHGADIDLINKRGWNALMYACAFSSSKSVIEMLLKKSSDKFKINNNGQNVFELAILRYRFNEDKYAINPDELVDIFLNNGFDINQKNIYGDNLLFSAVENKMPLFVISSLINKGINISDKNINGDSILLHCLKNNLDVKYIKFFSILYTGDDFIELCIDGEYEELKNKFGNSLENNLKFKLEKKLAGINKNIIEDIIKNKMDFTKNINQFIEDYYTPLMFACKYNNNEKVIKLLIENGACVNTKNNKGDTPLIIAYKYNKKKVIKVLLDNGAEIPDEYRGRINFMLEHKFERRFL